VAGSPSNGCPGQLARSTSAWSGASTSTLCSAAPSLNAYWHYAHYVQFAIQIYQQYQQLVNQYEQIKKQLLALRKLANPNWREIASLLQDLDAIVRSGQALGYALADAGAEFRQTFPGWVP
jgi:P-type conjugative transfer protein TrbJ